MLTKKLLLVISISASIYTAGCKKLVENPYSVDVSTNFYQNADEVMAAYVLPYSFIQTHIYQVHFALAEFATDEACVPVRFGYIDQEGQWIRLHQHTWTSTDAWILTEWQNMFQAIGYCNNFIDDIDKIDVSKMNLPIKKQQMVAEAKMVRALHYYWALSDFGNIPIVEHVGEINPPTHTSQEVFEFIEKEIKDNIPALGNKGDAGWYGHFTKDAAYALLAKLYLNAKVFTGQARWQDCIKACDAIIQSGNYTLDANWNDPFRVHNETSGENIYVVPFDASNAQQFNFAEQDLHENILFARYGVSYYGWHKTSTQESFFDLFSANDRRINQWVVGPQTYVDDNGDTQDILTWEGEPMTVTPYIDKLVNYDGGEAQGAMNIKYEIEKGGLESMNNDMVVLRLADIMMMKAECLMRINGGAAIQQAVDLVNQVRQRSFAANAPGAKYTVATLTLNELLNERGREFAYEMFRREDQIRFGTFNDAWWEKEATDKKYELYPIPFDVTTANPALKQNPGY